MTRYFTPGALAALYLPGEWSHSVIGLIHETPPPLRITSLHLLEMAEQLRDSPRALDLWRQDRRAGYFEVSELALGDLVRRAETLLPDTSESITTIGLLHLAAALEMECAEFVDFAGSMREAACAAGLRVLPEALTTVESAPPHSEPHPIEP